jgi:hypothetical protein
MRPALLIVLVALLAACASTPSYAPAVESDGTGFSHVQVEDNRFFVTYRAKSGADARLIEDYALLRAADLTLQQGREWFFVDRRSSDAISSSDSGPRVGVSVGGGSIGRRSGVGVGVGVTVPVGGGGGARATAATLEIRTGQGERPTDAANVYDARAVATSLRANLFQ